MQLNRLADIFRKTPLFKGKIRLGTLLFKKYIHNPSPASFIGKYEIQYSVPNTIDSVGRELYIAGIYEYETVSLIRKLLTGNSVFFDVGANIGAITLPIAKLTTADIHAFEPSAFIFDYLNKNVKMNCTRPVHLNQVAVYSSNNTQVDFYGSETVHGWSTMLVSEDYKKCRVCTVSLDAYCGKKNIIGIDVLKIDVQGVELEVLKGCQQLLKKKAIRNIILEFEHWAENNAGLEPGTSQEFLLNNGYKLFTLQNKGLNVKWTTGTHMIWAKA